MLHLKKKEHVGVKGPRHGVGVGGYTTQKRKRPWGGDGILAFKWL